MDLYKDLDENPAQFQLLKPKYRNEIVKVPLELLSSFASLQIFVVCMFWLLNFLDV